MYMIMCTSNWMNWEWNWCILSIFKHQNIIKYFWHLKRYHNISYWSKCIEISLSRMDTGRIFVCHENHLHQAWCRVPRRANFHDIWLTSGSGSEYDGVVICFICLLELPIVDNSSVSTRDDAGRIHLKSTSQISNQPLPKDSKNNIIAK